MNTQQSIQFSGLTPYVYYDDAGTMADWLTRVFGFVETGRHRAEDGQVQNVEMRVGPVELWLDGTPGYRRREDATPEWIGVWVDDVDAMFERVRECGVAAEPPEDKAYGVRMLSVKDPEGVTWGFVRRS